jgi:glucan endo-1,3-beta-D-glucosidase
MRSSSTTILALAAALSQAAAQLQGFNYGSTNPDGSFKFQADYQAEFKLAQNLVGTSGFNAARLYTMIVGFDLGNIGSFRN